MNDYDVNQLYRYICLEIKNQRQMLNKRQEEVAFDLNMSAGYLSRIENGKIKKLSLYTLLMLSDYYGIPFEKVVRNAKYKLELDEEM
ncbi:TPA: helix-turn-helix transcriptional regulator [Staphylococcus aureus]|uniref:helix-turn-helix domain-containing protein n=1 Tax=Staphylococcus TaxID=1279 RepID=UPI0005E385E1|nr:MULTISPECIES: helix-turn-helix transcriptional regulator [Terrabacteria group]MDU1788463.1 helix-turn-helix transcriptional regulator [Streptococcus thermophilus]MDU4468704.1 helix-turn-helix transcriptional regulator [Streptococcus mitis]MDU4503531.1 helix-turn-helix transcriptional regulator [Staphylococcus warneri]MDU4694036.1 helix-turn-helix transcriptional regulator [Dermabacter sp.]MDU6089916.1 helix-turn-helix transcriptional regulator [Staphylococcus lugdunensis]